MTRFCYRYRLYPLEKQWSETNSPSISYSHLDSGAYSFHVQARKMFGSFKSTAASISFSKEPTVYESWWFLPAIVILAFVIFYFFLSFKIRKYEKVQKSLQKSINSKCVELNTKQKELLTVAYRAGKAELGQDIIHNVGNFLNTINTSIEVLSSTNQTGLSRAIKKVFDKVQTEGVESAEMVNKMQDYLIMSDTMRQESISDEIQIIRSCSFSIKSVLDFHRQCTFFESIVEEFTIQDLIDELFNASIILPDDCVYHKAEDELAVTGDKFRLRNVVAELIQFCSTHEEKSSSQKSLQIYNCGKKGSHLLLEFLYGGFFGVQINFETATNQVPADDLRPHVLIFHYCANIISSIGGKMAVTPEKDNGSFKIGLSVPQYFYKNASHHMRVIP